jgi:hypothetical protein
VVDVVALVEVVEPGSVATSEPQAALSVVATSAAQRMRRAPMAPIIFA